MARRYEKSLNPKKALIWRIVHRDNLSWILDNGLHCGHSNARSPDWVAIGNEELINKRSQQTVPLLPGGTLNDYVPFYFTPFSPMMLNIRTGRGGVKQRANEDIVILVSSLHKVAELNLPFVFTDSHGCYGWANYYEKLDDLHQVDWPILQERDFRRDSHDPGRFERYQAEALVHQHCPVSALLGVVCYTQPLKAALTQQIKNKRLTLDVFDRPGWYFP